MINRFLLVVFRIGGLLTIALAVGLIALVAIFFTSPQTLVNNRTLEWTKTVLNDNGIDVSWTAADISLQNESSVLKQLEIDFSNLCYRASTMEACFDRIDLAAVVNIAKPKWPLIVIGPGSIEGGRIDLHADNSTPEKPSEPINVQGWVDRLAATEIKPLEVQIDYWKLTSQEEQAVTTIGSAIDLDLRQSEDGSDWILQTSVTEGIGLPISQVDLQLSLQKPDEINLMATTGSLEVDGILVEGSEPFSLTGELKPDDGQKSTYEINGSFGQQGPKVAVEVDGSLTPEKLTGKLSFEAINAHEQLPLLALTPCDFEADIAKIMTINTDLQLSCKGRVRRGSIDGEENFKVILPRNVFFSTKLDGSLTTANDTTSYSSKISFQLVEIHSQALKVDGGASLDVNGLVGGSSEDIEADLDLDLRVAVERFSELVAQLRGTDWAVPAPLNILQGNAQCNVSGRFETADNKAIIPVQCNTHLDSKQQAIHADATARIEVDIEDQGIVPHVDSVVTLNKVQLALPDLSISAPLPKLVFDSRIAVAKDEDDVKAGAANVDEGPPPLTYQVTVKTIEDGAFKVLTNLMEDPIPFSINVKKTEATAMSGLVAIRGYEAEMFRRQAVVDKLLVKFEPPSEIPVLDGDIVVDTGDYEIHVLIVGTTEKPQLEMYSDPPLPEQDILAMLIFGRKPDLLDPEERRSVEETRAAAADGAIGLISMYYLAKTPIESIGYNPSSGMLSAKVNLGDDLSLTVGTDRDSESRLGLKKRLGKNWSVETLAVKDEKTDRNKGVAMFTWSKRY